MQVVVLKLRSYLTVKVRFFLFGGEILDYCGCPVALKFAFGQTRTHVCPDLYNYNLKYIMCVEKSEFTLRATPPSHTTKEAALVCAAV
jgi:hypothetical protein